MIVNFRDNPEGERPFLDMALIDLDTGRIISDTEKVWYVDEEQGLYRRYATRDDGSIIFNWMNFWPMVEECRARIKILPRELAGTFLADDPSVKHE